MTCWSRPICEIWIFYTTSIPIRFRFNCLLRLNDFLQLYYNMCFSDFTFFMHTLFLIFHPSLDFSHFRFFHFFLNNFLTDFFLVFGQNIQANRVYVKNPHISLFLWHVTPFSKKISLNICFPKKLVQTSPET